MLQRQITNVRDGSKREEVNNLLSNGRLLYDQAHQNSLMSLLDWMVINDLLNTSHRQVQQAAQVSQAEPYTPPSVSDSSSYTSDSSSYTSDSSSYTSDSTSYASDFSSFGSGGDFGGGGGFSGGSGSDGSY